MVLVTGGTGLIGSHLLLHLACNGEITRAIYRFEKNLDLTKSLFKLYKKEELFFKIEWIKADILDIPSLEKVFTNIKSVYHCAARISFDPKDEELLRKVNIEGTANIVNFCIDKNVEKICFVSSIAALGDIKEYESTITEETEWNPELNHSDYAISKFGAEMEIFRGQQEGLEVVIVNPGVVLGAGFWQQSSGKLFSAVYNGIPFYTKGSTGFVSATDVVKIMHLLMNSQINGERFILISENKTFEEILSEMANHFKVKKPKFEAKPWMSALGWRIDWLSSKIYRRERTFSKYTAEALHKNIPFSNNKIKETLNYEFQNINDVIEEVINIEKNKPI